MALAGSACAGSEPAPGGDTEDAGDAGGDLDSGPDDFPDVSMSEAGEPSTDAAPPIPDGCGDGVRPKDGDEECDDGNNTDGDGCSRLCTLEEGYNCDPKGGGCAAVCGDGLLVAGEACDDMNTSPGDGCSASCKLESGWACPSAASPCVAARCGDLIEVGDEECDYGDDQNGDGCSADCKVEPGWTCGAGSCTAAECGDGIRAGDELCDDHNTDDNDGCTNDCLAVEPFYACLTSGGACARITHCGDGIFTADEQCDDGGNMAGDGCSALCAIEDGFACPGGTACAPICGDGKVRGDETCDDGNAADPGCSATCQIEVGYKCPATGGGCSPTVCGDGVREGLEECDDTSAGQADLPYDGCYECKLEPVCTGGACAAVCGDGIKFPDEACDDGNNRSGDGCSADCTTLEPGFACQVVTPTPPASIALPVIYRDFKSYNVTGGHPDFNNKTGDGSTELVWNRLGVDANNDAIPDNNVAAGSVVYKPSSATTTTSGAANFNQWYHDSARGKKVILPMTFTRSGSVYSFSDRTFYPLDGKGWQDASQLTSGQTVEASLGPDSSADPNACGGGGQGDPDAGKKHNYGFTSEVRFWFTYQGGEKLTFTGDDDVWVFIAGKRVIDLGGVHCAETSAVTLNGGDADIDTNNDGIKDTTLQLDLQAGYVYEVVVFQAERHTDQSSYRLELGQFFTPRTECVAVCGDGVRTAGELCDSGGVCAGGANDGAACSVADASGCPGGTCNTLNDGAYGHCGADCTTRGSYCGDGVKDAAEQCDSGAASNNGAYNGCSPNCTFGPRCGDGSVNAAFGEKCDQGAQNQDGAYNVCSTTCNWGARCGDGVVQSDQGEQCDDMVNKSPYGGCAPGCKLAPFCGDGVVQALQGEACDDGSDANLGAYGGCNADCSRAAYCGDKHTDAPQEQCDDGNANNFDGCSMMCVAEQVLL